MLGPERDHLTHSQQSQSQSAKSSEHHLQVSQALPGPLLSHISPAIIPDQTQPLLRMVPPPGEQGRSWGVMKTHSEVNKSQMPEATQAAPSIWVCPSGKSKLNLFFRLPSGNKGATAGCGVVVVSPFPNCPTATCAHRPALGSEIKDGLSSPGAAQGGVRCEPAPRRRSDLGPRRSGSVTLPEEGRTLRRAGGGPEGGAEPRLFHACRQRRPLWERRPPSAGGGPGCVT